MIKAISHPQMTTGKPEDECDASLHQLYQSLLGAVAYLAHTRVDICVFISNMQRHSHKSQIQHVLKLNKLLKWVQHHPNKLHFKRFSRAHTHLRVISDAAFKRENEEGYALRGALYVRIEGDDFGVQNACAHILDWTCRAQRHVARSTFAAELLSAADAVDQGILISHMMYEVQHGPLTAAAARQRRDHMGFVPMTLAVDAKSVYAAVTASFLKTPAEKSLLSQVQYIRELLDSFVLRSIIWADTRDMQADGLTKGAVDRQALHDLMECRSTWLQPCEVWQTKKIVPAGQGML